MIRSHTVHLHIQINDLLSSSNFLNIIRNNKRIIMSLFSMEYFKLELWCKKYMNKTVSGLNFPWDKSYQIVVFYIVLHRHKHQLNIRYTTLICSKFAVAFQYHRDAKFSTKMSDFPNKQNVYKKDWLDYFTMSIIFSLH